MVGAFAIPDNQVEECLDQATTEPNGQPRRRMPQQNHNPTVFKNLVFTTWYGHGLRAIDISNPHKPREVGHALTVPQGVARTYPVFKDGLIYWVDNDTGLHVARYTGPRADELPGRERAPTRAMPRARIGSDRRIDGHRCCAIRARGAVAIAACSSAYSSQRAAIVATRDCPAPDARDDRVRLPDASGLHARHRWHVPALRHGAGQSARRSTCATTGSNSQTDAGGRPGGPDRATLALPRLPSRARGEPFTKFETVHERQYHLFVISQDMEHFQHIHPEQQADGTWAIDVTLPKAGYYKVLSDFMPAGGASQLIARPLVTAGYAGDLAGDSARLVAGREPRPRPSTTSRPTCRSIRRPSSPGCTATCSSHLTDTRTGRPSPTCRRISARSVTRSS